MKTIVVVDDEFGLADVLAATLSDLGYRVLTAGNGVQGLALLRQEAADLVLLDYMMPVLDGPGALEAMRADATLAQVPVVLMSAMPESTVRTRCPGYQAFLRKPFEFETLVSTVRSVLGESP